MCPACRRKGCSFPEAGMDASSAVLLQLFSRKPVLASVPAVLSANTAVFLRCGSELVGGIPVPDPAVERSGNGNREKKAASAMARPCFHGRDVYLFCAAGRICQQHDLCGSYGNPALACYPWYAAHFRLREEAVEKHNAVRCHAVFFRDGICGMDCFVLLDGRYAEKSVFLV